MTTDLPPPPNHQPVSIGDSPGGAFGQPEAQALPQDFLAMLVALDRSKRGVR